MKKIFLLALAALALVSCEMDLYRSDALTAEDLSNSPKASLYTTNGIYTLFQDRIAYKGQDGGESGNYYVRHIFQINELRGDNVTVSGITEDPFINPYRYTDDNTAKNIYYTWWMAYKIIDTANGDINILKNAEASDMNTHLMGENYFFRAFCHFQMVTLFAMPYNYTPDASHLGVPLRLEDSDKYSTSRATVFQVYDQIVKDLKTAKECMAKDKEGTLIRGNDKGYASWHAAAALLARVYLFMGEDQLCINECNELLKTNPSALAGYDYADYPTHTFDHPETIWCVHLKDTHEWAVDHGEASIASMYIKAQLEKGTIGWGEHYWREDLIDLFRRYPEDKRFKAYFRMIDPRPAKEMEEDEEYKPQKNYDEMQAAMKGTLSVVYPVPGGAGDYCTGAVAIAAVANPDGSVHFQSQGPQNGEEEYPPHSGKKVPTFEIYNHVAKREILHNGRDTIYYVEKSDPNFPGKEIDGVKRVWVRPGPTHATPGKKTDPDTGERYAERQSDADARYKAAIGRVDNGGFYMRYYNTKFCGQGGNPMMTSPVFLRWGEVVLNRAEAYAHLGQSDKALADVNTIRSRAGIPAMDNYSAFGYNSVLDVVLDERRMELCFEGHRYFDVFRNKLAMDRRYIGYHTWEIIQPDDLRIAMLISQDEINSAGIEQNPR
jgi:hypothetical protein